ncbi:hypothetical protein JCM30237_24670 [Halolamina litorea]|uniref:Uncharacterized protein n=1 Tax=Halolamina litorea TaxID=1515593 RepID=A0ABD6BUE3_9EURY|nr:hypothetical protein [Halolamina litorea]
MTDEHTNQTGADEAHASNEAEIRSLGEDRYVVTPDGSKDTHGDGESRGAALQGSDPTGGLADLDGAYALELDARFGSAEDDLTVETNDVSVAFDALLRWYADKVAGETPPETVIATLLENTELNVSTQPSRTDTPPTNR